MSRNPGRHLPCWNRLRAISHSPQGGSRRTAGSVGALNQPVPRGPVERARPGPLCIPVTTQSLERRVFLKGTPGVAAGAVLGPTRPVEVINLGVSGYNPSTESEPLKDVSVGYQPELVPGQLSIHDLGDPGFAVIAFPFRSQLAEEGTHPVQDRLRALDAGRGWPTVDPFPAFRRASRRGGRPLFLDGWHPTAASHALASVELVAALRCGDMLPMARGAGCSRREARPGTGSPR